METGQGLLRYNIEKILDSLDFCESKRPILENLVNQRMSIRDITDYLNEQGYRTFTGRKWSRTGVWELLKELDLKTKPKMGRPKRKLNG